MEPIILTNNFKQQLDGVIGKIEFADTHEAKALYALLQEHPDWFRFEVGYVLSEDGSKKLLEVSLVSKHTEEQ